MAFPEKKSKKMNPQKVINLSFSKCVMCNQEGVSEKTIKLKTGLLIISLCVGCNWKSDYDIVDTVFNDSIELLRI